MVNKLVFSLIIASIAVVILAILFVLCRKKPVIPDRKSNKTPRGKNTKVQFQNKIYIRV